MESRRFLLALGLSVLVLLAWQYLNPPPPPPSREPAPVTEPAGTHHAPGETRATPPGESAATATADPAVTEEPAPPEAPPEAAPEAAEREERVAIDGPGYRAELTNRGAQLLSFELTEHQSADGGPVDLVRARADGPYPFALRGPGGGASELNQALFVAERSQEGDAELVEFRYSGPAGRAVKRFRFRSDGLIDLSIEVAGGGELLLGPGIRNPIAVELENRFTQRSGLYRGADGVERVRPEKATKPTLVHGSAVSWAGLDDTYFLTAIAPAGAVGQITFEPLAVVQHAEGPAGFVPLPGNGEVPEELRKLDRELQMAVGLAGDRLEAVGFLGAKDFDRLEALPFSFEESVQLGFFSLLARPLLWGLQWIHDHVVANYGWAIILMTILIRILLFPLTHKSFVSMQKMQALNPQLQSIRAKYRPKLKDKQGRANPEMQRKMNEEIMALYKKEGVNPAGGCLPMLLQIPVLFAFYSLLSTAIALRQAPWIFWIADLSAKDPYYVLPIVMGASQFVQQKLTPAASDPMQRRMFMMMPIIFTVLFLGFPSGLVLYWLTNNVLGIAQQAAYKKIRERQEEEAAGGGTKRGGGKAKA